MVDALFDVLAFGWSSLAWWHWALIALIVPVLGMVVVALVYFKICKPVLDAGAKLNPDIWSVLATVAAFVTVPTALLCWVYDIIFNLTYGSVLFAKSPTKTEIVATGSNPTGLTFEYRFLWTFSDRLQRYVSHHKGWRKRLAVRLARVTNKLTEPDHIKGV